MNKIIGKLLLLLLIVGVMGKIAIADFQKEAWQKSEEDWCFFAEKVLNVNLDSDQKKILRAIQHEPRVSVSSGNARGKDFVAAVASICWLHLKIPSKVINTAPTGRQVLSIMMAEIKNICNNARVFLGGEILTNMIKFPNPDPKIDEPLHYLLAFKAADTADEAWTGFHSPNLMVVVTEASGIPDNTFDNIEKILPGNSRLVIVFNPNNVSGEAYRSIRDPRYKHFRLNCLEAPNVVARKIIIPGQVDWAWVNSLVMKPGMCMKIDSSEKRRDMHDFVWEGQWYRPGNLFMTMVLGLPPREDENQLIPMAWIEMANERWFEQRDKKHEGVLRIGVDVAGMGNDKTSFVFRRDNFVEKLQRYSLSDHMATVGRIKTALGSNGSTAFIDTIGEGAGVYDRAKELHLKVKSAKFSNSAKDMKDFTGEREFFNMRAYCWWAVRDALDPAFDDYREPLALPPDDDLKMDLTEPRWDIKSNGQIVIEPKEDIKVRLGRSPDDGDALALTYWRGKERPKVYRI